MGMANGKQLSQKGAEEILDIIDSYIDVKEVTEELFKKKPLGYEMKTELEIYKDGFKDGYNKANEWHYVKDGDLPKATTPVLVILESGVPYVSWISSDKGWWFCTNYYTGEDDVIAWKEIVLPELKESK
jgi:hypothetical protein